MAVDNLEQEYHLTPRGWIPGTVTFFGSVQGQPVHRPVDAVETWKERTYQESAFSSESVTFKCIWTNPRITEAERHELRERFPDRDKDTAAEH